MGVSVSINTYSTKSNIAADNLLVTLLLPTKEHYPQCSILSTQLGVTLIPGPETDLTQPTIQRDHKSNTASPGHQARPPWSLGSAVGGRNVRCG